MKILTLIAVLAAASALPAGAQDATVRAAAGDAAAALSIAPSRPSNSGAPTAADVQKAIEAARLAQLATAAAAKPIVMPVAAAAAKPVDINTATLADLEALAKISGSRAKAVAAARPYKSIDELVTRKVIPQDAFDAIKGSIAVR